MHTRRLHFILIFLPICLVLYGQYAFASSTEGRAEKYRQLQQLYADGNCKDALDEANTLLAQKPESKDTAALPLIVGLECLNKLKLHNRFDDLVELALKTHPRDIPLLVASARGYLNTNHRAQDGQRSQYWGSWDISEYDRLRALQIMAVAMDLLHKQSPINETLWVDVYTAYTDAFIFGRRKNPHLFQHLTDLNTKAEKKPHRPARSDLAEDIPYEIYLVQPPLNFSSAKSDSERWRFLLESAIRRGGLLADWGRLTWSRYLQSNLDVTAKPAADAHIRAQFHALASHESFYLYREEIQRITLPPHANFISLLAQTAEAKHRNVYTVEAAALLAEVYEKRDQRKAALAYWRIAENASPDPQEYSRRIQQITKPYGRFEPGNTGIAYRYRNANSVQFSAFPVDTHMLVAHLQQNARENWRYRGITQERIGEILVDNKDSFLKPATASWKQPLQKSADHDDRLVTVQFPTSINGPYVLTAELEGGNTAHILRWQNNLMLTSFTLENEQFFLLADAATGQPKPNRKITFWSAIHSKDGKPAQKVKSFSKKTNRDGWLAIPGQRLDEGSWLIYTTDDQRTATFLNLSDYWFEDVEEEIAEHTRAFFTTSQPAYRPGQTVRFKGWIGNPMADLRRISLAGQSVDVHISDPRGDTILDKTYKLDKLGGFDDEFVLPEDASLGVYDVEIGDGTGYESFVVEEYKKPEFSVKVAKDRLASRLSNKINIPISAQYYYGQPVRNAEIQYEISAKRASPNFVQFPFDWLYGPDYAWLADTDLNELFLEDDILFQRYRQLDEFYRSGTILIDPTTGFGTIELNLNNDEIAQFPDLVALELHLTVTDDSRRSVELSDELNFSKNSHQLYSWPDKGFYRVGDSIQLKIVAQTAAGNPITLPGELSIQPWEKPDEVLRRWTLDTDNTGNGNHRFSMDKPGLYRLKYEQVTHSGERISAERKLRILTREGSGAAAADDELTLLQETPTSQQGESTQLFIASNLSEDQSIILTSPTGFGKGKKILHLKASPNGKVFDIKLPEHEGIRKAIHAITVGKGQVFQRDIYVPVPPSDKFLTIGIQTDKKDYLPGETASLDFVLKDFNGRPVKGDLVVAIYDQALEPFAEALPDHYIESVFYSEYSDYERDLYLGTPYINLPFLNEASNQNEVMQPIGFDRVGQNLFRNSVNKGNDDSESGDSVVEEIVVTGIRASLETMGDIKRYALENMDFSELDEANIASALQRISGSEIGILQRKPIKVRRNLLDSAYWRARLPTDKSGRAVARVRLPDNMTSWKIAVWAKAEKTKVGEGKAEIRVSQPFIVRAQTPRFLVEEDEVTLSANIMNNASQAMTASASIETSNNMALTPIVRSSSQLNAQESTRMDWQARALESGTATVIMQAEAKTAQGDSLQDGLELSFPIVERGQQVTKIFQGTLQNKKPQAEIDFQIPAEHKSGSTQLELDYSPYLVTPALKALPYLSAYPYGCTEQTLNRFLPSAIAMHALEATNLDLADVVQAAPKIHAAGPILNKDAVQQMAAQGMSRLAEMQNPDGGWDWFSGGGHSYVHTTGVVMQGLTFAKQHGLPVNEMVFTTGLKWLNAYQDSRLPLFHPSNDRAKTAIPDHDDALVAYILALNSQANPEYLRQLYHSSPALPLYSQVLLALAFHQNGDIQRRDAIHAELQRHLSYDDVYQTAFLQSRTTRQWWRWYNSDIETQAYYLMYLNKTDPRGTLTTKIARYISNNRTHGSYWESTRDSSLAVTALVEHFKNTHKIAAAIDVILTLDDKAALTSRFNSQDNNFPERKSDFQYSHQFEQKNLAAGSHRLKIEKQGQGDLYYTAHLSYFSKEAEPPPAKTEVGIQRHYYLLRSSSNSRDGFVRERIQRDTVLQSGDLVEIELLITSTNDYEYILIEDRKPAGFETLENRSGYNFAPLSHYVEYRDDRVAFFLRDLPRGECRLTYRAKTEIPGHFTALPATIGAMYSPRLRGHSEIQKFRIID